MGSDPLDRAAGGSPAEEGSRAGQTLADRIGVVVGSSFVSAGIGMVQGVVLVRLLDKTEYGAWALCMVLFGTGRDLALAAVPESLLYFAPKVGRPELLGLARQSMRILGALALLVALVFAAIALSPTSLGARPAIGAMLLLGAAALFALPASIYGSVFVATDHHRASASAGLVVSIVQIAAVVVPAALGLRLEWMLAAYAASMALRFGLYELVLRRLYRGVSSAPFPGGLRAPIAYAAPLALTRVAGIVNQRLDKLIVGLFFSASAFADIAVGAQELPLVTLLPYSIAGLLLPKMAEATDRHGPRAALAIWHAGMRKASLVMVPVAIFLLVAAEPFVLTVYGDRYQGAVLPFRIYTALLPLRVTGYGVALMALGRTREVLRAQLYGLVVGAAATFALVHFIGVMGAPIASVAAQAFMIGYLVLRVRAAAGVSLADVLPWRSYFTVVAAALFASAWMIAMSRLPGVAAAAPALRLAVAAAVFTPAYLFAAIRLGALGAEDRAFVARWARLEPLRRT